MGESIHVSVLRDEVVSMIDAKNGGTFLDCTFGGGGHSRAILEASPDSRVFAVDRDPRAIERARRLVDQFEPRLRVQQGTFSRVLELFPQIVFDGIVADLGLSTDQLHEGRGFSFADDAPIDMRMNPEAGESAAELINRIEVGELFRVLRRGGVGQEARAVSSLIIKNRPFESARALAECLRDLPALRAKKKKAHPATVIFQALRVAVNQEFDEIDALLTQAPKMIRSRGRLAVITFHSLEDRLVTQKMRSWENQGTAPANFRGARTERPLGKVVTRKPLCPSEEEVRRNPSARSAQLRVFEFA